MAPTNAVLSTPLTNLLDIRHPILLAGMAHTSTAPLAAAVSNAGGLGTIGGLGYTPSHLRSMIQELKSLLRTPRLPFGVDLALPAVGGTARKTNHDYTNGLLSELIDVIIQEKTTLFVSAVGVPPAWVIQKLHTAGIVVMNMVGHPKHAKKALDMGVDIICAQGGEGGGHTGDIPMSILVPACVDVANTYHPALLSQRLGSQTPALVVAAGGISDGRGLAASLTFGAVGVWVGTRFVASVEAGCSDSHKQAVVSAGWEDTLKTLVISGRPLRVKSNAYINDWHNREGEMKGLLEKGVVPMEHDMDDDAKSEKVELPYLMGQVAATVKDVRPAEDIMREMIREAVEQLDKINRNCIVVKSNL